MTEQDKGQTSEISAPMTMKEVKQLGNEVELLASPGGVLPAPKTMGEVLTFAQMMAKAGPMVGKNFQGNIGACLGIYMQSIRWGMDPFAVSQKSYVVPDQEGREQIAYEAQLVNAVINSSSLIRGRLRASYSGDGDKRQVVVTGYIGTDPDPYAYESPPLHKISGRSPLWKKDPDQQLFYFASRSWARRYVPDLLMGVYTEDEIRDAEPIKNVTPASERVVSLEDLEDGKIDDQVEDGTVEDVIEQHREDLARKAKEAHMEARDAFIEQAEQEQSSEDKVDPSTQPAGSSTSSEADVPSLKDAEDDGSTDLSSGDATHAETSIEDADGAEEKGASTRPKLLPVGTLIETPKGVKAFADRLIPHLQAAGDYETASGIFLDHMTEIEKIRAIDPFTASRIDANLDAYKEEQE